MMILLLKNMKNGLSQFYFKEFRLSEYIAIIFDTSESFAVLEYHRAVLPPTKTIRHSWYDNFKHERGYHYPTNRP